MQLEYTGGDRGWKGDVPVVRLNTDRIRGLGWSCRQHSHAKPCASPCTPCSKTRDGRKVCDECVALFFWIAMASLNRAVLREGKPYPPATLADLRLLAGVREACRQLREAGFALILITNQPDIARGVATGRASRGDESAACSATCSWTTCGSARTTMPRAVPAASPSPGLLLEAARDLRISILPSSYIVGDRWRDIEAGHRAGCRAVFVDYGYRERRPDGPSPSPLAARGGAWILRDDIGSSADMMTGKMAALCHDDASLRVKIFADGADRASILELAGNPLDPGLHHQSHADAQGRRHRLRDVRRESLRAPSRTVRFSFEVFSDDFDEMERQALRIASWGENVYVKIPITNTRGQSRRRRWSTAGASRA